uniref:Peptidyl-prolyl cis-trans isomerase n=1 Tax=Arundo donax TaxID=35708 RepID=A0A0A9G555_ARUDO
MVRVAKEVATAIDFPGMGWGERF